MSDFSEAIFPQRIRDLVVHCKRDDYDVLVDRRTKWGNPKRLEGYDGDRVACLQGYLTWLQLRPTSKYDPQHDDQYDKLEVLESIGELEGKVLACWCAPRLCHAHVLAAMAAADDPEEAIRWIRRRIQEVTEARQRPERNPKKKRDTHPDPHSQMESEEYRYSRPKDY